MNDFRIRLSYTSAKRTEARLRTELADIRPDNVASLRVAWSYRYGDFYDPGDRRGRKGRSGTVFEGSPILVDGRLVFSTPYGGVIAVDPETGHDLWVYDPKVDRDRRYSNGYVTRGVAYWEDRLAKGECAGRILEATVDPRLIAIDAGPITYRLRKGGKQYLVVAPGGHHELGRLEQSSKLGDWIIAYRCLTEAPVLNAAGVKQSSG